MVHDTDFFIEMLNLTARFWARHEDAAEYKPIGAGIFEVIDGKIVGTYKDLPKTVSLPLPELDNPDRDQLTKKVCTSLVGLNHLAFEVRNPRDAN